MKGPGGGGGPRAALGRFVKGSTGGPDEEARARSSATVVAKAFDGSRALLETVRLEGINAYTFTAEILAWGATTAARGGVDGEGALGPVEAFGLDQLQRGVEEAGLARG